MYKVAEVGFEPTLLRFNRHKELEFQLALLNLIIVEVVPQSIDDWEDGMLSSPPNPLSIS
jgi:hypothetical protein